MVIKLGTCCINFICVLSFRIAGQCWSSSILEVWSFDEAVIESLTTEVLLENLTTTRFRCAKFQLTETVSRNAVAVIGTYMYLVFCSPVYGSKFEAESFLGGVERDSNGNILSASATTMSFFLDISGEDVFDIPDVRSNP